uniref:Ras guanyl-releasing protein 3 n=1 Tax=Parascaris univalens TaxID=6257 RepID=A0A915BZF2_PARUN
MNHLSRHYSTFTNGLSRALSLWLNSLLFFRSILLHKFMSFIFLTQFVYFYLPSEIFFRLITGFLDRFVFKASNGITNSRSPNSEGITFI